MTFKIPFELKYFIAQLKARLKTSMKEILSTGVGTLHYSAPEQRSSRSYNYMVDIYATGYVLFELFYSMKNLSVRIRVFEAIRKEGALPGDFGTRHGQLIPAAKSRDIHSMLRRMMDKDAAKRITAHAALESRVFTEEMTGNSADNDVTNVAEELARLKEIIKAKDAEIEMLKQKVRLLEKSSTNREPP